MQLTDLFSLDDLKSNVDQGFIRAQIHPNFPELVILNYTEAAQFSRAWNKVTRMCRGLIWNTETGEVLARPFQKIHNWDEAEAPRITWEAPLFHWSNKEDGSLGIVYVRPDGALAVATRGSFASEQAWHATSKLAEFTDVNQAFLRSMIEEGYTPLYEIVYPENRIVLDYGDVDRLFPLGFIHIATGAYVPAQGSNKVRRFEDVIQDLSRPNSEGWVVWLDPYKAVKIKQADYVELHRVVTGLNRKSIWRAIVEDRFTELVEAVPDELYAYVTGVRDELSEDVDNIYKNVVWYESLAASTAEDKSQKAFAIEVKSIVPVRLQGLVFSLHAGKDIRPAIWKSVEPIGGER